MKTTSLLDSIRVVKENERKAAEFYADAAEVTGSPAGRELFGELVKFENYHYHWLTVLEKSLKEKGVPVTYEGREFSLPPVLEPQAAEEPRHQTVLDIISRAMELEREVRKSLLRPGRRDGRSAGPRHVQKTVRRGAQPFPHPSGGLLGPGKPESLAVAPVTSHTVSCSGAPGFQKQKVRPTWDTPN